MANQRKILLVDDDDDLREALAEQLTLTQDFDVTEANSAVAALARTKENIYDLILLDVGLPDADGRELCRLIRKQGMKCPILMLTGHDTDADTIYGLDAGANDYIAKPFKFPVLLARLRVQLRQHEQSEDAIFSLAHYTFRPAQKLLLDASSKKVRLTEKETSILSIFTARDQKLSLEKSYCTRFGVIMQGSRLIRWKLISTVCAKRSNLTHQKPKFY